jgi:hypothetical protein
MSAAVQIPRTYELRVELYTDGPLPVELSSRISEYLAKRWPVAWDVKVPSDANAERPAEWRAVVPAAQGLPPERQHRQIVPEILAFDPSLPLHVRTRWSNPEFPDNEDIFEESWTPSTE